MHALQVPADNYKEELIRTIGANRITVLEGPTGSGKTTRTPLFLLDAGFTELGRIGVTEPRRDAATTVADYDAELHGTALGDMIGYQIRHDDQTTRGTRVAFMTEGILLRQLMADPLLQDYSVIMVDEAHERNLNTDFLLGLLKDLMTRRSDLRLVVASATIDTAKFSRFLDDAPIVSVEGRTFPVEIVYHDEYRWMSPEEASADLVAKIHTSGIDGDILIFMPGEREIYQTIDRIRAFEMPGILTLPLYAQLDTDERKRAFRPIDGKRKVVVATNIAETSLTIDGIVYVIDPGLIKQTDFDPRTGIGSLAVVKHSQAGCDQRAGRAGRTQPGVCHRLFSEDDYLARPTFTKPEIQRISLAGVVLQMKDMGIQDVENFPFMDQPDPELFKGAHRHLISLGALTDGNGLTETGRKMAKLPMEPHKARMILEAAERGCVREVAIIVAMTSTGKNPFAMPPKDKVEERAKAEMAHAKFRVSGSDHLTLLKLFEEWQLAGGIKADYSWSKDHYINRKAMEEAAKILDQIDELLYRDEINMTSSADSDQILKSVTAGLLDFICVSGGLHSYTHTLSGDEIYIHPGSGLFHNNPRILVANELVTSTGARSTKTYARTASAVKADWLIELLPASRVRVERERIEYKDYTDTVNHEYEIVFDGRARISVSEPATGDVARRGFAKAMAKEYLILGKLKGTYAYCRVQDILKGYDSIYGILREAVKVIASQIIYEQLGEAETIEDILELQIVLPEWLTNRARMQLEANRIFPNTITIFEREYLVTYRGVSYLEAHVIGLTDEIVGLLTYDDLPALPVLEIRAERGWHDTSLTLERVKEQRAVDGYRVLPIGKPKEYIWQPLPEGESLSAKLPQSVVVAGRELTVSYSDMTMRAKVVIPEELSPLITESDTLPSVHPYEWQITATVAGRPFNPAELIQIANAVKAEELKVQANEELKHLEGNESYEAIQRRLDQPHLSRWTLEDILVDIEAARQAEGQRTKRQEQLDGCRSTLAEWVETFLAKCPICGSVLADDEGCKCVQSLSASDLESYGVNSDAECDLVKIKTEAGVTVARIYYCRAKDGTRRIKREVAQITEPFDDLDVVEHKL